METSNIDERLVMEWAAEASSVKPCPVLLPSTSVVLSRLMRRPPVEDEPQVVKGNDND